MTRKTREADDKRYALRMLPDPGQAVTTWSSAERKRLDFLSENARGNVQNMLQKRPGEGNQGKTTSRDAGRKRGRGVAGKDSGPKSPPNGLRAGPPGLPRRSQTQRQKGTGSRGIIAGAPGARAAGGVSVESIMDFLFFLANKVGGRTQRVRRQEHSNEFENRVVRIEKAERRFDCWG